MSCMKIINCLFFYEILFFRHPFLKKVNPLVYDKPSLIKNPP